MNPTQNVHVVHIPRKPSVVAAKIPSPGWVGPEKSIRSFQVGAFDFLPNKQSLSQIKSKSYSPDHLSTRPVASRSHATYGSNAAALPSLHFRYSEYLFRVSIRRDKDTFGLGTDIIRFKQGWWSSLSSDKRCRRWIWPLEASLVSWTISVAQPVSRHRLLVTLGDTIYR